MAGRAGEGVARTLGDETLGDERNVGVLGVERMFGDDDERNEGGDDAMLGDDDERKLGGGEATLGAGVRYVGDVEKLDGERKAGGCAATEDALKPGGVEKVRAEGRISGSAAWRGGTGITPWYCGARAAAS